MASHSLCSIPDCCKPVRNRGWCNAHYQRWQAYGDPNHPVRTPPGTTKRWLEEHRTYNGEGCLIWPFARGSSGDPHMNFGGGKFGSATRFMCELVNGPAPSPAYTVGLTCGTASNGCVHPNHVFWAEPIEPIVEPIERDGKLYCGVPGCRRQARMRGVCNAHYHRFSRYGSPMAGGTELGAIPRWLEEHASYSGDQCLIWPFARNAHGYAICDKNLGGAFAPTVMCRMAHGEPPTPLHEAAHSCGKGNLGCMNPNHLSWKTHAENMADTLLHGTHNRGERNGMSRLTEDDVRAIRASTEHRAVLAKRYGISRTYVYQVRRRLRWKWLK